jgi:hypothetical protein
MITFESLLGGEKLAVFVCLFLVFYYVGPFGKIQILRGAGVT